MFAFGLSGPEFVLAGAGLIGIGEVMRVSLAMAARAVRPRHCPHCANCPARNGRYGETRGACGRT